jgi:hypothetical protein
MLNHRYRAFSVQATQSLNFGTFALTGGDGILSIGTDGYRNAVQNVFLSELSPIAQPAILKLDCVKVEMLQLI